MYLSSIFTGQFSPASGIENKARFLALYGCVCVCSLLYFRGKQIDLGLVIELTERF